MTTTDSCFQQYEFTCRYCARAWRAEYEVRTAWDAEGTAWVTYRRGDGAAMENPTAALHICPTCHHAGVSARLLGRHDRPALPEVAANS